MSEEATIMILTKLSDTERAHVNRKGKIRFKIIILTVVVIVRLRWLVKRWKNGKRAILGGMGTSIQSTYLPVKLLSNHSPPVRERPSTK